MVEGPPYAAVAVPLPLDEPLVYAVPDAYRRHVRAGVRARVRVGRRRLTGVVVDCPDEPPADVKLRPLEGLIDREPILDRALLELAEFVADYYLAPLGEVLRAVTPSGLEGWGDRRVSLTDGGAIAQPRSAQEAELVEALRSGGPRTVSELQRDLPSLEIEGPLEALAAAGRVRVRRGDGAAGRLVRALELAPGEVAEHLETAGRSAPGRRVVHFLADLGRPATAAEITAACECGGGVLRRLTKLGVLKEFQQLRRLSLGQHVVPAAGRRFELRPDQRDAVAELAAALEGSEYAPFFLAGVTGAGKTEVYLQLIERAQRLGRAAIVLVPEIALVPALAGEVRQRFGNGVAILHSSLGPSERRQEWERIRRGEAPVVLGPRSAIFAPVSELGVVVVDEEQDTSYKQETTPRYNARDLALVRGSMAGAVVVLVSATPSLETRLNVERGKVRRLELTGRVGTGRLPEGVLVDLRSETGSRKPGEVHFSDRLLDEIEVAISDGSQVILLRNRRGYAPLLLCRACGEDFRCEDCGLPRTVHRRDGVLLCHYCGERAPIPDSCPQCAENALESIGAGTERVEERFQELFPGVPVDVLDRDSVRRRGSLAAILERFGRGESRVLIGTQMVSKGHHFPQVALTAVLSADTYLGFPDFRAVERTYSLLTQLAGRSGRGDRPGKLILQTHYPEHYAIQAALGHDDARFAEVELRFRRVFHYPPYTRMAQLLVRDTNRARGESSLRALASALRAHPLAGEMRITGPAPAPLERLRGKWRFQLLVRGPSSRALRQLLGEATTDRRTVELVIDVDPYQLL